MKTLYLILLLLVPVSAATAAAEPQQEAAALQMGNGEHNSISVDDSTRTGNILNFAQVQVESSSWLVMHPFEEGKPNGDKYVAATYVKKGNNKNVAIEVYKGIASGELFIVMLHKDSNANQIFDFVFVDDTNVMDKAVFEGNKMIGHIYAAP